MLGIRIAGTGSALPEKRLTNDDLSHMVDTSDEWISSRTGISERGILSEGESVVDLAVEASRRALEDSGLTADAVQGVLVATISAPRLSPNLACEVQAALGVEGWAMDVSAACSGFIYALQVARGLMAVDPRPIVVVGAEHLSRLIDWEDRNTCVLFGDGAGAVVVEPSDAPASVICRSFPDAEGVLLVGGESPYIRMDGRAVYKFAVKELADVLTAACADYGIAPNGLDHVVAHQANVRIIDAAASRMDLSDERFFKNIALVGNTSAASVPIALDDLNRSGGLSRGQLVGLVAFGGGLSSGAAVFAW